MRDMKYKDLIMSYNKILTINNITEQNKQLLDLTVLLTSMNSDTILSLCNNSKGRVLYALKIIKEYKPTSKHIFVWSGELISLITERLVNTKENLNIIYKWKRDVNIYHN